MAVKKGQKLKVNPTPRQKKVAELLYRRDVTPERNVRKKTDKEICNIAGYAPCKPSTDIIRTKGVQIALREYYKYPDLVEERLRAKMLRNIDDGLDVDDEDKKLAYTNMQVKREDTKVRSEAKFTIKTENLNMLNLLSPPQEQ